jgi:hypothetical protein
VRQNYGLTDTRPIPGANYYRLTQIDFDGTAHAYKPVVAIVRPDEMAVIVYPLPASSERIHAQVWNAENALVRLLTNTGRVIDGKTEQLNGETDFVPAQPLPPGLYFLEITTPTGQKRTQKVLVR